MLDVQEFEDYRPLMLSIAYRMLGSMTDAEDIVQKAYLRYATASVDQIISLQAYLSTVVTRLCLDHLQLAYQQRESYVGPWLPEPILGLSEPLPGRVELHDSLSMAFLILLEQLTPLERAVFLLHEVFEYDYKEVAEILDKEEAACRQLFSRAKKHIAENRPRFKAKPETHRQILDQFIGAVENGELESLLQLLTEDVELWGDSNGKLRGAALDQPLRGRDTVARFVLASPSRTPKVLNREVSEVNGEPAIVLYDNDVVRFVLFMSIDAGLVRAIYITGNPDKLRWINHPNGKTAEE